MLSLSPLTVLPCGPLELIDAASKAGFDAVGLRPLPVLDTDIDINGDPALRRAVIDRLKATGTGVFDLEVIRLSPDLDPRSALPLLEFGAEVNAMTLTLTGPPKAQWKPENEMAVAERAARLCEIAEEFGIRPMVEFMAFRGISTLGEALRFIKLVGHPRLGISLDALHLFRSGGTVGDVAALKPGILAGFQLCDATATAPADLAEESRYGRMYPGEGDIPLKALLDVVPADVALAVEAPCRQRASMPLEARAMEAMAMAKRLINDRKTVQTGRP